VSCVVSVATNLGSLEQNELTLAGRHVAVEACAADKGMTWNQIGGERARFASVCFCWHRSGLTYRACKGRRA
jgi:hypothetical protein